MREITRENVKGLGEFKFYRKRLLTRAIQVDFDGWIATREGKLKFYAGDYIAIDSAGFPYPISKDEFERIYEEVSDDNNHED